MNDAHAGQRFDAFISYRHLPQDMRTAERLQRFLETYRAPKGSADRRRIGRVFRDKSELPTSNDLAESLRQALLQSDYLVILLSETTRESKYCMEEIRFFKEAHGGKTDHIIPVLLSGEPDQVIPELLRYEDVVRAEEDGQTRTETVELEPLCCDLRSTGGRRSRQNNEFLRICARILGCRYDDLYQRHRKRQRIRRTAIACAALAVLSVILVTILASYFRVKAAYEQVSRSEQQAKAALMNNYVKIARSESLDGDPSSALAYYASVLSEDPSNEDAKTGALAELQHYGWLCEEACGQRETGPQEAIEPPESLLALGTVLQQPDDVMNYYAAMNDSVIRVWLPETDELYEMENRSGEEYWNGFADDRPTVIPVVSAEHTCFAVLYYCKSLYVYAWDGEAPGEDGVRRCGETRRFSWEELHEPYGTGDWDFISETHYLFADGASGRVLINEAGGLTLVNVYDGTVLGGYMLYAWVGDVLFSPDGEHLAIVNAEYTGGIYEHMITVFNSRLYPVGESARENMYPYCKAAYAPDGQTILWATRGSLCRINAFTAEPDTAKIICPDIEEVEIRADGLIQASCGNGETHLYRVLSPQRAASGGAPAEAPAAGLKIVLAWEEAFRDETKPGDTYYSSSRVSILYLELKDTDGQTLDAAFQEDVEAFLSFSEDYSYRYGALSPDGQTAVSWNSRYAFDRVTVDPQAGRLIRETIEMPSPYRSAIESIAVCNSGCAVLLSGGTILTYANGRTEPDAVFRSGSKAGSAYYQYGGVWLSDTGLLALESTEVRAFWNPEQESDIRLSLELWNSRTGEHIANLIDAIPSSTVRIDQQSFSADGILAYQLRDSRKPGPDQNEYWRLTADDPDEQAVQALLSLTCYRLTEEGALTYQTPVFSGTAGSWQAFFPHSDTQ